MKAEFSEFSYGFAFTENLIRSNSHMASAPAFLNNAQEFQQGCDLILKLDSRPWNPLFFQFKISDVMTNRRAREISEYHLPIHPRFFRMSLHKNNSFSQQRALANLGKKFPHSVFYAAPRFHRYLDLNVNFRNGEVHNRSILFSPVDIENANISYSSDNHSIAYKADWSYGWLCSRPKEVNECNIGEIMNVTDTGAKPSESVTTAKIDKIVNSLAEISFECGYIKSRDIIDSEVSRIKEMTIKQFGDRDCPRNLPKIQAISSISRNCFGSEMLFSLG